MQCVYPSSNILPFGLPVLFVCVRGAATASEKKQQSKIKCCETSLVTFFLPGQIEDVFGKYCFFCLSIVHEFVFDSKVQTLKQTVTALRYGSNEYSWPTKQFPKGSLSIASLYTTGEIFT